jgi:hypothetical protein
MYAKKIILAGFNLGGHGMHHVLRPHGHGVHHPMHYASPGAAHPTMQPAQPAQQLPKPVQPVKPIAQPSTPQVSNSGPKNVPPTTADYNRIADYEREFGPDAKYKMG